MIDSDGDGLSDAQEINLGTNPTDSDSDDDGVPDGQEPNPTADTDGDGLINMLDPDSDNDGLFDWRKMGFGCGLPDTSGAAGTYHPRRRQRRRKTNPLDRLTAGGGAKDGAEDWNHNGAIDAAEVNPAGNGADDINVIDSDGDGLGDAEDVLQRRIHFDADQRR
ncbi:MAG: hypothetical protein R3F14_06425 [Polyangiaceae bacterium]